MSSHTLLDMCTKAASFGARLLQFVRYWFCFLLQEEEGIFGEIC